MTTPQDQGREFEVEFAKEIGGRTTPGSGNKWYSPLDVQGAGILWSLKFTTFKSYPLSHDVLDEALDATIAPGGSGAVPALAIRVRDKSHDVVVLRKDDFFRLIQEKTTYVKESKAEARRRTSKIPILFRDNDEDNIA